ncbi:MAG: hypothetical protein ABFS86_11845 [Planctomycetota bacterium]
MVIQFPAVRTREAAGRTCLDPGVETALVRLAGEKPLTVFVSAVPVEVPDGVGPTDTLGLLPESERPSEPREPEPDPHLDRAAEREPPTRGRRVAIAIGTLKELPLTRPLHLDAVAGALFLSGVDVVRQTSAAAAAEPGAGLRWLLETSYLRDTVLRPSGVPLPKTAVAPVGFEGWFDVRDGETVLDFQYSTLSEIRNVSKRRGDVEFPVERPMMVEKRGVLRLRGAVDVMPIGTLTDGRTLVLVVRRAAPR